METNELAELEVAELERAERMLDEMEDDGAVQPVDPDAVRILTIEGQMKVTLLAGAREIGRILSCKKESLPHGEWGGWLKKNLHYSQRKATDMIRIYRCYGAANWQTSANFTVSKALALLALPESEREEFVESSHQVNGQEKTVADMSTRELEQAIRERDEARATAEEAKAAWRSVRSRYDEAEKLHSQKLAKLERVKSELDLAIRERDEARKEAEDAKGALSREKDHALNLSAEIKELKARPVEVAVERDEEALQELEEERDKALEEIDALRRSLAEADANHMEADAAREVLSQQMKIANARIRELESGGTEGVDTNPMQFRLFVDQAREYVNRSIGVLLHLCDKEDQTEADKARAALMELAEYIREAAA